jgi:glutathione reductase (NADPH)
MPSSYDFDLFVIGAGSGGVRGARVSAGMGARVAIAESDKFGGTCVVRGCIPKKLMVYASACSDELQDAVGFGWTIENARFDWNRFIARKDAEIARISGVYRRLLAESGVEIFEERVRFLDSHTIELPKSKRRVTAEIVLIATGGYPARHAVAEGADLCITSDDAFHLKEFPRTILIVGAGYIALEFAHIFHGMGSEVALVYRGPRVLRGFDDDLRIALQDSMQKKGIRLVLDIMLERVERKGTRLVATAADGQTFTADQVMLAVGRHPNVRRLGLNEAGVKLTRGNHVEVDRYSRTTAPNIYAVGDVTGRIELTPVAIHEAMCFAQTVFGDTPVSPDHALVATAVFTRPEIGTVGLTEVGALKEGHTINIYKSSFKPLKHTLSGRDERSLMKLVVDAETDRVLGCHIFGPEAGEMVQLAAIALKMGATKAQFDATIAVHPTMAEELVTIRTKSATKQP